MHCFKACLRCRKNVGRAVDNICQPLMGHTVRFSNTADSQIAHKIPDFQYPFSTKMGYCATKRDISIHCSWSDPKPSLDALSWWYLRASLCIFLPLMGLTKTCPTNVHSQNAHKMPNFKYPIGTENGTILYNERHTLLMKWFRTFLRCMRQIEGASLCILLPLMVLTQLYSTKADSQIAQNTRCWVRPLSTKIACCSERRDIHCLWSVSKQSWDAWAQWEGLLIASVYQLLVQLSHFLPRLALRLHAKCHILNTLSVQTIPILWDVELQGETSIAYEVFQNLP